jgi:hypothetical protein
MTVEDFKALLPHQILKEQIVNPVS